MSSRHTLLGSDPDPEVLARIAQDQAKRELNWHVARWWLLSYKHGECTLRRFLDEIRRLMYGADEKAQRWMLGWAAEQALAIQEPRVRPGGHRITVWMAGWGVLLINQAKARGLAVRDHDGNSPGPAVHEAFDMLRDRRIYFDSPEALLAAYRRHRPRIERMFPDDLAAAFESEEEVARKARLRSVSP